MTADASTDGLTTTSRSINETSTEYYNDVTLAIAFFLTTLVAAKRMHWSYSQGGVETTVVTAFYSLILITSLSRTLWFTIPSYVLEPSYAPGPIMAFGKTPWVGTFVSEVSIVSPSVP